MANPATQKDYQQVSEELQTLRADVSRLAESVQQASRHAANDAGRRLKDGWEHGKQRAVAAEQEVEKQISSHPMQSVGIAFGVGFLIGKLASR